MKSKHLFFSGFCTQDNINMEEEEFSLKWSGYSGHLSQMLQDLMTNQSFTDVKLVCDDKVILNAHKIVLTSSSGFFQRILYDDNESKTIIYLRNINHIEMQAILDFIYLGKANFLKERSKEFIRVALDLELKAICQDVEEGKSNNEAPSNDQNSEIIYQEETFCNNVLQEVADSVKQNISKPKVDKSENLGNGDETLDKPMKATEQVASAEPNISNVYPYENVEGTSKANGNPNPINPLNSSDIYRLAYEDKKIVVDPAAVATGKHVCLACSIPFVTKAMLWTHCRKYHKGEPNMCNKCGFKSLDKNGLKQHKISTHNYRTCSKCDFIAFTPATVEDHIKEKHEGFKIKCENCDFASGRRQLQLHRSVFHGSVEKEPHSCKICEFTTYSLKELSRHMTEHKKNSDLLPQFSCEKCKFSTYARNLLDKHLLKHSNRDLEEKYAVKSVDNEKRIYHCNDCEYQNPVYGNLKHHIEAYHLGIKYQCDQCGYAATKQTNLTKHIEFKHLKIHKWKCEQCNKTFIHRQTWKVHVDTVHHGIKFPCTLCRSEFNKKGNLTKHIKVYHSAHDNT